MRLAACALSAVLLSGCSWLGTGGQSNGFGTSGGAYGANCAPVQTASYGQHGQAASYGGGYGFDPACAGGAYGVGPGFNGATGFGAGGAGFGPGFNGANGFGAGGAGFGPGANGFGAGGAGFGPGFNGANGFGTGGAGFDQGFNGATGFGAGGAGFGPAVGAGLAAQGIGGGFGGNTVFSNGGVGTQFGNAAFSGGNVVGTQLANGQFVNGAAVQNVVGAPIFVPQPFAAPFGVPQIRGVGAALPFGFEVFGGTEFDIDGTAFNGRERSPSDPGNGGPSTGVAGEFADVDFDDAFSDGYTIGGAATYDISRNTTLLASAAFSDKNGRTVDSGSFQSGTFTTTPPNLADFTPDIGSVDRDLQASFTDLEQYTLEAGVRRYVGNGFGLRPYVGATGGFTYNNDVEITQTFTDTGEVFSPSSEFIDSGWRPTAAGVVGAELAVGPRAAIGVETGIRWRDGLKGDIVNNDDRFSIPLNLRGRLAF